MDSALGQLDFWIFKGYVIIETTQNYRHCACLTRAKELDF
jgi:hypothetical protein